MNYLYETFYRDKFARLLVLEGIPSDEADAIAENLQDHWVECMEAAATVALRGEGSIAEEIEQKRQKERERHRKYWLEHGKPKMEAKKTDAVAKAAKEESS